MNALKWLRGETIRGYTLMGACMGGIMGCCLNLDVKKILSLKTFGNLVIPAVVIGVLGNLFGRLMTASEDYLRDGKFSDVKYQSEQYKYISQDK